MPSLSHHSRFHMKWSPSIFSLGLKPISSLSLSFFLVLPRSNEKQDLILFQNQVLAHLEWYIGDREVILWAWKAWSLELQWSPCMAENGRVQTSANRAAHCKKKLLPWLGGRQNRTLFFKHQNRNSMWVYSAPPLMCSYAVFVHDLLILGLELNSTMASELLMHENRIRVLEHIWGFLILAWFCQIDCLRMIIYDWIWVVCNQFDK